MKKSSVYYPFLCCVLAGLVLCCAACGDDTEDKIDEGIIPEYTVTFDTNGGTSGAIGPVTVAGGSSLDAQYPSNPGKDGFNFTGWYDETVSPAKRYTKTTPVTKDVDLTAKWVSLTPKDLILQKIEETWPDLGYTEKPTKYTAISFDDGPCPPSNNGGTAAMLAKLDELNVKATFFVIGGNVNSNQAVAKAIFDAGHELGNHSNGYDSIGNSAVAAITTSLNACSTAIKNITGEDPVLFRSPNLNTGNNLFQVCTDLGMAVIHGQTHNDWDGTGHTEQSIKTSVLANPIDGGIILLHDNNTSKGDTMAALPDIISGLREKGFWIMTVSQLAIVKEIDLEPGKLYNTID